MMISKRLQRQLIRILKIFLFTLAVVIITNLTQNFGILTSAPTAAFCFLIVVLLSAFFGDIYVAVITSLIATLCFDYFYLPPKGTLNITAFADWISLGAFLLTSVIISHLTASAAENKTKAVLLDKTLLQFNEFGEWLISQQLEELTLTGISDKAVKIFSLDYCSIHVFGEGKWQHFTGSASPHLLENVKTELNNIQDHYTNLLELAVENSSGVIYKQINKNAAPLVFLAVKSKTLTFDAIGTIAYMIGIRLTAVMNGQIK